jgi:putative transposase
MHLVSQLQTEVPYPLRNKLQALLTSGSTYTSEGYQALLRQEGMIVSMSRMADCYDSAAMESFFHSFKGECIDDQSFQTRTQARSATFDYLETFYNRTRRHSTLQYLNPVAYEQVMC